MSLLLFCSIVSKVRQHEEFFPTFYSLITDILQTLGKSYMIFT